MAKSPFAISLIAATAQDRVLGANGAIPWHLPQDFAHFKRHTLHKPIIMGRKTFLSIGKPLVNRFNIVLSTQPDWHAHGVTVCHQPDTALAVAIDYLAQTTLSKPEIMIIGGASIYELFLPLASTIYLTDIELACAGDTFFPAIDPAQWQQTSANPTAEKTAQGVIHYTFQTYQRI